MSRLILFNKPYGVLTQFTGEGPAHEVLAHYIKVPGVYAAGRLDKDSEGLLVLTDDGAMQARISAPRFKLAKTYLVQVEGVPTDEALTRLAGGVKLNDGPTLPAKAQRIAPPEIWPRDPPVRFRKSVADSWISLTITEGRNRQVRRMTAAVGFPTLRLVRWAIGPWTVDGLAPGEWRDVEPGLPDMPKGPDLREKRRLVRPGSAPSAARPASGPKGRRGSPDWRR